LVSTTALSGTRHRVPRVACRCETIRRNARERVRAAALRRSFANQSCMAKKKKAAKKAAAKKKKR
jgi:hypothetical protein